MKILVANCYYYRLDKKQWEIKQPYPPLQTILVASVLRTLGAEVTLFDCNLRKGPQEFTEFVEKTQFDLVIFYDDGFNYLSKMCLLVMREAVFSMIRDVKSKTDKIIICSSDSTDHYEKYLNCGAGIIVFGEGEKTIEELYLALRDKKDYSDIPGIAYSDSEIIKTPKRQINRELDQLPFPSWDLIDIESYRMIWKQYHGYFSLNVATTRGCPYKCNWCAKPIYGNRYNSRSPENVVAELKMLYSRYEAEHIWFCDDIFGLKPGWVQQFDAVLKKEGLRIRYKNTL
jgi:anaerobic magnesium-protoporphyrin IX monomethyl ester cyclase